MQRISDWLNRNSMYIALLAAWIAMCGSLYFSEVKGYIPCILCWYQRILMYPLAGLIAIGLLRRDTNLPYYILPFSLFGLGMATYHYLLEKTDLFVGVAVCRQGVSCTTQWINWLGFITIPFLSLVGFLVITVMSIIALINHQPALEDDEGNPIHMPVLRVGATVVTVLAVFAALFVAGRPDQALAQSHDGATISTAQITPGPLMPVNSEAGSTDPAVVARGEALYNEACVACHGLGGLGVPNLGSALTGSAFMADKTDQELLVFVREGREHNDPANTSGQVMPPSGGRPDLSDEDLIAVFSYIRSLPAP